MQPHESPSDDDDANAGLRCHVEAVLRRHARRLNARWWRWDLLGPSYHLLADALVWADEVPLWGKRSEVEDALRVLWHYRTGLILGEARPFTELWELAKRLFPDWVGFHSSRCRPARRYLVIYRAGRIASEQCLNELEREAGGSEG